MPHSEINQLQENPRVFRPFTKEKCRILIFDVDADRIERIISKGCTEGFIRERFRVVPPEDYEDFFNSYERNAKYIQHVIVNYDLTYEGENLYKRFRELDTRKSKVWFKPEEFDLFPTSGFEGLLTKINLCENDIVHSKHLLYSKRKSYFFELLTERLHKIADDDKIHEQVGQNVVERILEEILATEIMAADGTDKSLNLEYFLPVSKGLSISLIHEEGGIDYLVNESTCIQNLLEFGLKRVITSGIRMVIDKQTVGVVQDFSKFLEVEPQHEVINKLYRAGLNSSIYTVIKRPGQERPFGVFFGYSSQKNIFNHDHAETIQKLARLVGLFYDKLNRNKEVRALTDELLDGITNVRQLQDMMMGTEILSTTLLRNEFSLDIDCFIRHPFISNKSFVSLNGDSLKFMILNESILQISSFDICGHGIYSGMLGLITHSTIDTISTGETSRALLENHDFNGYMRKFAKTLYDYYFYNLSKGDYTNIATNMAVFNNVVFDKTQNCAYILRLGFHSPIFYSAHEQKISLEEEWGNYNNLVVGVDPFEEVEEVNVQKVCFSPGDILVFYSDGFSEQENDKGETYGTERIHAVVTHNAENDAGVIKQKIIEDFTNFLGGDKITNDDDLSFIIIKKL